MEVIRGKASQHLDLDGLATRAQNYKQVVLDLGTGDGRYVRFLANRHPDRFVIGADACRENLRACSRLDLPNALFVVARAQNLPHEFDGWISYVTINFPWGSLLESLLTGDAELMDGLARIAKPQSQLHLYLNGGALAEAGSCLEAGTQEIFDQMNRHGWNARHPYPMHIRALRQFPTTWAKRLAYGRDPRAMVISGALDK